MSDGTGPSGRLAHSALNAFHSRGALVCASAHHNATCTLRSQHLLGRVLIACKDFKRAAALLRALPDHTSQYLAALASFKTNEYSAGLEILADVGKWDPTGLGMASWTIYVLKGRLERALGRHQHAACSFRKAVDLNPLAWAALKALAEMQEHLESKQIQRRMVPGRHAHAGALADHSAARNGSEADEESENWERSQDRRRKRPRKHLKDPQGPESGPVSFSDDASELRRVASAAVRVCTNPVRALEDLRLLSVANSSRPLVLALKFHAQFNLRRFDDAEITYKELRMLHGDKNDLVDKYSTILWVKKRECKLSQLAGSLLGLPNAGLDSWKEIEGQCSIMPRCLLVLANSLSLKGKHREAVQVLKRALEDQADYSYGRAQLGREHSLSGEHDNSEGQYLEAVRLDPKNLIAWHGLGTFYLERGRLLRAESRIKEGLRQFPRDISLTSLLAKVHHEAGELGKALKAYGRCFELEPGNPTGYLGQAAVYKECDTKSAIKMLQKAIEVDPDDLKTVQDLARQHAKLADQEVESGAWYAQASSLAQGPESMSIRKEWEQVSRAGPESVDRIVALRGQRRQSAGDVFCDPDEVPTDSGDYPSRPSVEVPLESSDGRGLARTVSSPDGAVGISDPYSGTPGTPTRQRRYISQGEPRTPRNQARPDIAMRPRRRARPFTERLGIGRRSTGRFADERHVTRVDASGSPRETVRSSPYGLFPRSPLFTPTAESVEADDFPIPQYSGRSPGSAASQGEEGSVSFVPFAEFASEGRDDVLSEDLEEEY